MAAVWTAGYIAMLWSYLFSKAVKNIVFEKLHHADTLIIGKEGTETKKFQLSRKSHCTIYLLQNDFTIVQGSLQKL